MFAVHARGAFLCYKYAVRQMIKQGRGGRIVGACSLSGLKGKPNDAHYCAAKFAIRGLTQSVGTSLLSPGAKIYGRRLQHWKWEGTVLPLMLMLLV